ncbi:hypothetical protein GCM10008915_19770 [Bifidobacterium pullorum subsp. gallinarum]
MVNWNHPDYRTKAKGVQLHPTPHDMEWEEAGYGCMEAKGSFQDGLESPGHRINKGFSGIDKTLT